MDNPMDIWRFLAPIILEFNPKDTKMYVTVYHALKLEEEYQKSKENEHDVKINY